MPARVPRVGCRAASKGSHRVGKNLHMCPMRFSTACALPTNPDVHTKSGKSIARDLGRVADDARVWGCRAGRRWVTALPSHPRRSVRPSFESFLGDPERLVPSATASRPRSSLRIGRASPSLRRPSFWSRRFVLWIQPPVAPASASSLSVNTAVASFTGRQPHPSGGAVCGRGPSVDWGPDEVHRGPLRTPSVWGSGIGRPS
jgi:hypothetical protein